MPLFSNPFKKKGPPPDDGKQLLSDIEKWLTELDPHEVTMKEWTAHRNRQTFLAALPGAREFLESLKVDVGDAIANPKDKSKLADARANYEAINTLANDFRTKAADLKWLERSSAMNSGKTDPELQKLYKRFEDLTGHKSVAEITSIHNKL